MTDRKIYCLLSIITLLLGTVIYIILRENSYIGIFSGNFRIIRIIREYAAPIVCDFTKYYFPDLLWGFSLGCGLLAIYTPKPLGGLLCAGTAFLCGCIWEFLQFADYISGTGDFPDVLMYLLASALCSIINIVRSKQK